MPPCSVLPLVFAAATAVAQHDGMLERVARVLAQGHFDPSVRAEVPRLLARHAVCAEAATTPADERAAVQAMLAGMSSSHLALVSAATHERWEAELAAVPRPTLGCSLLELDGRYFVDAVLAAGPAARAGVQRGEEVLAIDGAAAGDSPRLDWRDDDACLPDPPTHGLLVRDGDLVELRLRSGDQERTVLVRAAAWSSYQSSIASIRELEAGEHRVVHVHLGFVYHGLAAAIVRHALAEHAGCRGLVLDLRGRGGSATEAEAVVDVLRAAAARGIAIAALIDGRTRSAKETIADRIAREGLGVLVGERTAGALLVAAFADVGDGAVLLHPCARRGADSDRIEGHGVLPHLAIAAGDPRRVAEDPILRAALGRLASRASPASPAGRAGSSAGAIEGAARTEGRNR